MKWLVNTLLSLNGASNISGRSGLVVECPPAFEGRGFDSRQAKPRTLKVALMPSLQHDRMCQDKVISSVPGILMKITKRSEVRGAESSWHSPKA